MAEERVVPRVAALARLALDEEEAQRLEGEMSRILAHVERLQELPLDDVDPTYWSVSSGEHLRPDAPTPSLPLDDALAEAPARAERLFVVPGFREDEA